MTRKGTENGPPRTAPIVGRNQTRNQTRNRTRDRCGGATPADCLRDCLRDCLPPLRCREIRGLYPGPQPIHKTVRSLGAKVARSLSAKWGRGGTAAYPKNGVEVAAQLIRKNGPQLIRKTTVKNGFSGQMDSQGKWILKGNGFSG